MVHFPGLAHTHLCIQWAVTRVHLAGFLHSDIPGSKPACGSPRLIAACHVLHRLLAPRHPPYALSSLIIKLTQLVDLDLTRPTHRTAQLPTSWIRGWVNRNPGFRLCAPSDYEIPSLARIRGQDRLARCWLNSPCNSSTVLLNSSRTCNNPHHGVEPDRNQVPILGVELPAFQLSMNVFFRFHRNAPGSLELVWRDLCGRSGLAFQRDLWRPKRPPKIRNPASSAGYNPEDFGAPREARQKSTLYS